LKFKILFLRLGLLPLKADPRLFEYPSKTSTEEEEVSDQDTLRYEIKAVCKWNPQAPKDSRRPDDIYSGNNGRNIIKNFYKIWHIYL
jgi:hypothetical protein